MSEQDILKKKDLFLNQISKGRLHDSFATLRQLAERRMAWELTDDINRREEIYRYMLDYAMRWADDPHRDSLYDGIVNSLLVDFDRITRSAAMADTPQLYYEVLRSSGGATPEKACTEYVRALSSSDALSMAIGEGSLDAGRLEGLVRSMFLTIWTTFPLSEKDAATVRNVIDSDAVPYHVKRVVISALTLAAMQFFDDAAFLLLAETYRTAPDERLALPALVGLVLALYVNRSRRMSLAVSGCVASLRELPSWNKDIRAVFINLIRTRDTERITRKLRDEVVPEMMKMKPKITKDFPNGVVDINELEENPEWQEILEQSGIADKMKELTEIQEEGGDVLMGTFAHLKSFPFFYEIANWFLPFHSDNSEVARIGDGADVIAEMIAAAPMLCESDKFSFILALNTVPPQQREMMLSHLKMQNVSAAEIQNASLSLTPDRRDSIINRYVQDLYRFYNLFRRHSDFVNPFAEEINLTDVPLLADEFSADDTLLLVGEFYFKHRYFREAFNVFSRCEPSMVPSAQLFQKMGYCRQQLGNAEDALRYYEQAELLDAASVWTLRRIALCRRALGRYSEALDTYRRIDALMPDNYSTIVSIGELLTLTGRYGEAIPQLFKAVYLDEDNSRPWRPLAWALTMTGDFERAHDYYRKVLADSPSPVDYINLGHLCLLEHDSAQAVNAYKTAIGMTSDGRRLFTSTMADDAKELAKHGISQQMINFAVDSVLYSINS